jgi:hypothetical protein
MIGHFTADLFKVSPVGMEVVKDLTETIMAPFHLFVKPLGTRDTQGDILALNVNDVMEVIGEPAHFLRDLLLGFAHCEEGLGGKFPDNLKFFGDTQEKITIGKFGIIIVH